jgi:hypothetical protein
VTVSDGFAACSRYVPVKIQKERKAGGWRTVALLSTDADGDFWGHVPNRPGMYRAKAMKVTLQGGAVCGKDVSPIRRH